MTRSSSLISAFGAWSPCDGACEASVSMRHGRCDFGAAIAAAAGMLEDDTLEWCDVPGGGGAEADVDGGGDGGIVIVVVWEGFGRFVLAENDDDGLECCSWEV